MLMGKNLTIITGKSVGHLGHFKGILIIWSHCAILTLFML